ncbi:MAG: hypothetical protein GH144_07515 [Clostridia bacterium]|nr:hypothetical protein [Clostridia bacterium]
MVKKKKKFKFWILDSRYLMLEKTKEKTKDEYRVSSIEIRFTSYSDGRNCPSVLLDFSKTESMIERNLLKRESSIETGLEPSMNNEE